MPTYKTVDICTYTYIYASNGIRTDDPVFERSKIARSLRPAAIWISNSDFKLYDGLSKSFRTES
jgi:hypothetical protein